MLRLNNKIVKDCVIFASNCYAYQMLHVDTFVYILKFWTQSSAKLIVSDLNSSWHFSSKRDTIGHSHATNRRDKIRCLTWVKKIEVEQQRRSQFISICYESEKQQQQQLRRRRRYCQLRRYFRRISKELGLFLNRQNCSKNLAYFSFLADNEFSSDEEVTFNYSARSSASGLSSSNTRSQGRPPKKEKYLHTKEEPCSPSRTGSRGRELLQTVKRIKLLKNCSVKIERLPVHVQLMIERLPVDVQLKIERLPVNVQPVLQKPKVEQKVHYKPIFRIVPRKPHEVTNLDLWREEEEYNRLAWVPKPRELKTKVNPSRLASKFFALFNAHTCVRHIIPMHSKNSGCGLFYIIFCDFRFKRK